MSFFYLISVFIHVVCAAFWIGGMLFLPLVILPGIRQDPNRISILYKTGIRFRYYGWISLLILVITGLLNMHLRGLPFTLEFFTKNNYGILVSYKAFLFMVILLISGLHDFFIGKKAIEEMELKKDDKIKTIARWSGRINLFIALVMAFIGVALVRGGF